MKGNGVDCNSLGGEKSVAIDKGVMNVIQQINRRGFLGSAAVLAMTRLVAGQDQGVAGGAPAEKDNEKGYPLVVPGYFGSRPGIQLGTQLPANASDDDMRFTRQLGVEWVMTGLPSRESTLENYQALIRRFAAQGLKIYRLANNSCHNMEEVTLNLPGRDAKIDEYLAHRAMREKQIVSALRVAGSTTVDAIVETLYTDLAEELVPMAAGTVWAHLLKLKAEGRAKGKTAKGRWTAS